MKTFWKITLSAFLIYFFSWFVVYKTGLNTHAIQSEDTIPTMFIPVTIIQEGTLYADTYIDMIRAKYPHPDDKNYTKNLTPFYYRKLPLVFGKSIDLANAQLAPDISLQDSTKLRITYASGPLAGHYVSAFPIISGLLAVPVYLLPLLLGVAVTWSNLIILSHIAASLIVAFAGGFFYLLLKNQFLLSEKKARLLTYVYLFATINYALVSQALWQHGTVQLFTILGLILFFKTIQNFAKPAEDSRNTISRRFLDVLKHPDVTMYLSGVFFGIAILARPTAALFWPLLFILLYWTCKASLSRFIKFSTILTAGLVPVFIFFVAYNKVFYKSITNQGYADQATSGWLSRLPEGFLGLWVSPSKGILVYSPIFIFIFLSLWQIFKEKLAGKSFNWNKNLKYLIFLLIVISHTLVYGKWKHWYGGYSYGYRMASDVIPFLVLLLIPYVQSPLYKKTIRFFMGTFILSILIQVHGIIFFDGIWHAAYDKGFVDTAWLWSVRDSEFAFNIRRILVKFNVLESACPKCLPKA